MRTAATGFGTPYPIGTLLPPVLQDDPTAMRITDAFDQVIAPAIATLDCLWCYFDPRLAPADFLAWLAGWVGVSLDECAEPDQQRDTVAGAVALHRARGTVRGLRAHLESATGATVEVVESGGVAASTAPDCAPPGSADPTVLVRVHDPGSEVDLTLVERLVAEAKPAHVTHRVERAEPGR